MIIEKKLGIPADYQYQAFYSYNIFQSNWHRNKFTALRQELSLNKNFRVLDLGTGSGLFEILFARFIREIVGVDYNDEALLFLEDQLKKRKISNIKLIEADIRNLAKLKNLGKFDLIVMADVIEHVRLYEANKVVSDLKNLLKEGGKICVITPNSRSPWIIFEKVLNWFTIVPKMDNEQHLAKYHCANLSELFSVNDFRVERLTSFNLFSFLFPILTVSTLLVKLELNLSLSVGNLLLGVFSLHKKKF